MRAVADPVAQRLTCNPWRPCASAGGMQFVHSFWKIPVSGYLEADSTAFAYRRLYGQRESNCPAMRCRECSPRTFFMPVSISWAKSVSRYDGAISEIEMLGAAFIRELLTHHLPPATCKLKD